MYNQIQDQLEAAEPVGVPNVVGIERDLAIAQIEDAELEAAVEEQASTEVEQGIVIEQQPPAGSRIAKGDTVTIVVSTGPNEVEVPALAGRTYEEAVDTLEELGLDPERVDVFSQRPVGVVASLDPKAGTLVDEGSVVTVRVSKGSQLIPVPDVLDQSEESAREELETAGFQVNVVEAPSSSTPAGLVSAQSPDPGVEAARGSTVQITISTGPEQVRVPDVVGLSEGDAPGRAGGGGLRRRGRVRRRGRPRPGRLRAGHRSKCQRARRVGLDRDDQGRPGLLLGATRSPGCA